MKFNFALMAIVFGFWSNRILAVTYHVGPKQKLSAISEVPWEALRAGDEVLIDWRAEPYKEKWVICRQGTEKAPIIVRGIPGKNGELPVIDGDGAKTRSQLRYFGDVRSVIKIGLAQVPAPCMPQWIVLENLEIRSARPPFTFKAAEGEVKPYSRNAAPLWIEKGQHVTVRHCTIRDGGNGLFVSSNNESASRNILIEGCHIFDNGNVGSGQEHNVYTEALGITFQYNYLGRLRTNCIGNNLKDRSAGLVARYNWIEGGDKELDLVDAEDSLILRNDPSYLKTFIYGNVIIKPPGHSHPQIVHFGGDGPQRSFYRRELYFYNNTVISRRKGQITSVFWLSNEDQHVDCRNNIFYLSQAAGKSLLLLDKKGSLLLSHNWLKGGWQKGLEDPQQPVRDDGTSVVGVSPGWADEAAEDFRLSATSPCRNAGADLNEKVLPQNDVEREYLKHQAGKNRFREKKLDIGAYGFSGN